MVFLLYVTHVMATFNNTVMRRLTMRIYSEKRVVRRFIRCANVIACTYTNLDSVAYCIYASLNDDNTF
jgi:hypothetical protein